MQTYNSMLKRSGFSLVELSIVLVILGLLTGGILSGQALIRAAELRSISTDAHRFVSSFMQFRDKYLGIAGDLPNAYVFWGTTVGCTDVHSNVDPEGCNGNGDGRSLRNVVLNQGETSRAWQHLQLAGLIEGSYSGKRGVEPDRPKGRLVNSVWGFSWYGSAHGWAGPSFSSHQFYFSGGNLRPEEAWGIDQKMDDGRPGKGRVVTNATNDGGSCVTGTNPSSDEYALQNSAGICHLIFSVE